MEDLTTMTAELCIAFCKSNSYTFAGLEYTRYVFVNHFFLRWGVIVLDLGYN
jgi:hypothetical protein